MSKAKTLGGLASTGALAADSSGKVGVGTTTPSDNLHVVGSLRITGAVKDGANSAGTSGYFLSSTGTGTQWVVPPTTLTGDTQSSTPFLTRLGSGGTTVTGTYNTFIGYQAANSLTSSEKSVVIGAGALYSATTGASYNIAIGFEALYSSNALSNVAIGYRAGYSATGQNNVYIGVQTGYATPGNANTGVGARALYGASGTGTQNTALGYEAGYKVTNAENNTFVGYQAGYNVTTPNDNVFIGAFAGNSVSTGGNNLVLGYNAQPTSGTTSNEITLGNASITRFRIPGLGINWTTSNIPVGIDVLKIDTISTTQAANNTTTAQIGWRTLTSQTLFGQTDGCMYTSTYNTGSMHQIFGDYRTGQVAIRGRESGTWTSWRNVLDSSNHTTYTTGPTFRAYRGTSSQTVSANSWNKVQFNTESWDTDNAFDSTTNYRFTPQKAGYYTVNVNIGSPSQAIVSIWKNGAEYLTAGWGSGGSYMSTGGLVYFNGSTDYIEGYIWTDGTSVDASATGTVFSAIWVRA